MIKTTKTKYICIYGKALQGRSRLYPIMLHWCISLLNETSPIFGNTDSCTPYIKLKMPWQPLFLGNCRIMCVVFFLYDKYKWKVAGKIKCCVITWRKSQKDFLKITNTCSFYDNLNDSA